MEFQNKSRNECFSKIKGVVMIEFKDRKQLKYLLNILEIYFWNFFKFMIQCMIEEDLSLWIIFNTVPLVIGSNRTFSISNGELVTFNVTDGEQKHL